MVLGGGADASVTTPAWAEPYGYLPDRSMFYPLPDPAGPPAQRRRHLHQAAVVQAPPLPEGDPPGTTSTTSTADDSAYYSGGDSAYGDSAYNSYDYSRWERLKAVQSEGGCSRQAHLWSRFGRCCTPTQG